MPVEITQFKRGLIYQDKASSKQIHESLDQIRAFDKDIERTKSQMLLTIVGAFIVGAISVIAALMLKSQLLMLIPILCAFVFIGAMVYRVQLQKFDLQNRRYELLHELSDMLGRDMPRDSLFDLSLDLAPVNEKRKKSGREKVNGWDVTFFDDPWLNLEGRFADGTVFEIKMLDRHQDRKKWARSRSGKSKLKTKAKTATVASVNLFPKQKKYSNLDRVVNQTQQLLRLPDWVRVKKVSAEPDRLMVVAVTSEDWSVRRHNPITKFDGTEIVVTMLLSLYQVLHASKTVST